MGFFSYQIFDILARMKIFSCESDSFSAFLSDNLTLCFLFSEYCPFNYEKLLFNHRENFDVETQSLR